ASEQGYPYANHEGGRIEGRVADEILMGPPRLPRGRPGKPLTILGVACTTLANHSACIVQDGVVVAAIQEERIRRRKQLGWHPPGRPEDTVVSDSALPLSRCQPNRSIESVLAMTGLSMEDIDCIAYNGVPARWFPTYSLRDPNNPPRTVRFGREIFIPHHLTHAASAYRVSGMDQAFVFTVDGRGERETAGFFESDDRGALHRVFDIRCNEDSLIGGVYEFITTILGFGHYGQGSTMGLAAMGRPTMDLSRWLSARSRHDYSIHDTGIMDAFGHLARERGAKMKREHVELAASIQYALEEAVLNLIEDGLGGRPAKNLCLAGGVALNCSMNQRIRAAFDVENIFVQPGAHDAGTSVGAALEAHWEITGERGVGTMTNAYWGPGYTDAEIEETLKAFHLPVDRRPDIASEVAERLVEGEVVCWFQGRMEFGPRALGARSILADPRSVEIKDHVNRLKGRQKWRPFG
ncbi:MAG: carbamoyltransferase N-terminal domain-containing protein, partial [Myxococcota bacterium]|nr:carbamoyltransferase N-terminal domain-containing protein [Myxococcota bacterium]